MNIDLTPEAIDQGAFHAIKTMRENLKSAEMDRFFHEVTHLGDLQVVAGVAATAAVIALLFVFLTRRRISSNPRLAIPSLLLTLGLTLIVTLIAFDIKNVVSHFVAENRLVAVEVALGSVLVVIFLRRATTGDSCSGNRMACLTLVVFLAAVEVGEQTKFLIKRQRPELAGVKVSKKSYSFPSNHATRASAVYLLLALLMSRRVSRWWLRLALVGVACLIILTVGFSRLYLGAHYLTDVLAGWAAGAGLAFLALWLDGRMGLATSSSTPLVIKGS